MQPTTICYILLSVSLNAIGQLLLKTGANRLGTLQLDIQHLPTTLASILTQAPILGGLLSYIFSITIWIVALSRVDVMIAAPLLSIGYIINTLGAWYFLGEALTLQRLLGIAVIMLGVYLLIRN